MQCSIRLRLSRRWNVFASAPAEPSQDRTLRRGGPALRSWRRGPLERKGPPSASQRKGVQRVDGIGDERVLDEALVAAAPQWSRSTTAIRLRDALSRQREWVSVWPVRGDRDRAGRGRRNRCSAGTPEFAARAELHRVGRRFTERQPRRGAHGGAHDAAAASVPPPELFFFFLLVSWPPPPPPTPPLVRRSSSFSCSSAQSRCCLRT